MHRLAVGALVLAGCLGEKTKPCKNGATCPYDEACTEAPVDAEDVVLCGAPRLVETCTGKADFSPCDFTAPGDGACRSGICFECTTELAGCSFPGWTPVNTGTTPPLHGAWVPAVDEAFVVGKDGALLRYNGFRWTASTITVPGLAADADFLSVWGADRQTVFAVADKDVLQFDGTTWSRATTALETLNAVAGSSATNVFAVGLNGAVSRFDGAWSSQRNVQGIAAPLKGIWVFDAQNAIAVGGQGVVLRYRNGAWEPAERGPVAEPVLNAVWGRSPTDIYAVGNRITTTLNILHYDGTGWTRIAPPGVTAAVNLTSVWGKDNHVFVAGAGVVLHFDGTTWTETAVGAATLDHITGSDPTNVLAVGVNGAVGTVVRYTGD